MIKLGPVNNIDIKKLKPNKSNKLFFKAESSKYFNGLMADIKKRGILVALVAKRDGTLLAGHNRLLCARMLKMKTVPVQYVAGHITEKDELEYIIKDNLLRRHLNPTERESLYHYLYKDFDERIMLKNVKGITINPTEIGEATGLNPKTVNYDITRIRRRKQKEINKATPIEALNDKAIFSYKKSISKMLNIAIIERDITVKKFKELTKFAMEKLEAIAELENPGKFGDASLKCGKVTEGKLLK